MLREIVTIDERLCDGCGLCVPACHEGALKIVDGKARLVADRLCDGLGACLGHCPRGAIKIEQKESEAFDEQAVAAHLRAGESDSQEEPRACPASQMNVISAAASQHTGCPGTRFAQFSGKEGVSGTACSRDRDASPGQPSALKHWPVQLRLLSPMAGQVSG